MPTNGKGRTARQRTRKKTQNPKNFVAQEIYYDLLKSMKREFGFKNKSLAPFVFKDTGRGMMAKTRICEGDVILSIPQAAMVGVNSAFNLSKFAQSISSVYHSMHDGLKLSGIQILCIFLIEEKRKLGKNKPSSTWGYYVKVLPQTFTHPLYWEMEEIHTLPKQLQICVNKTIDCVKQQFKELNEMIKKLKLGSDLNYHEEISWIEYRWAWCCVNTRCVYSTHDDPTIMKCCYQSSAADKYFLVPYLDLLNHSNEVNTKAEFNNTNKCFELRTHCKFKRFAQVFISYGALSNSTLLVEYGFVCKTPNKHDVVALDVGHVLSFIKYSVKTAICPSNSLLNQLKKYDLDKGLAFTIHGPSWTLIQCVVLAVMTCNMNNNQISKICLQLMQKSISMNEFPNAVNSLTTATQILQNLCAELTKATQERMKQCRSMNNTSHIELVLKLWQIHLEILETSLQEISTKKIINVCFNDCDEK
nr:SET domain-containing protein 4 [Ciona intestinalis]|eukprot:XP_002130734.1 SET domain-containing protein 4 [Ciona intestinalis]